jgi:Protein of unknown function (DUF2950)
MKPFNQLLSVFFFCSIVLATCFGGLAYAADEPASPTPLVSAQPGTHADAGVDESAARRIGENESMAIQVCRDLVRATQAGNENATGSDPAFEFARELSENNPDVNQPFHGYKFRIGSEQPVGVVLVAYPAEYGISGVMTLVVLPGGAVYEKDLGSDTASVAPQINGRPDGQWTPVQ